MEPVHGLPYGPSSALTVRVLYQREATYAAAVVGVQRRPYRLATATLAPAGRLRPRWQPVQHAASVLPVLPSATSPASAVNICHL